MSDAKVLIVDDRLPMAETLVDGLADRGYAASAVDSGRAALGALAENRVDVLVTDLRIGLQPPRILHRDLVML